MSLIIRNKLTGVVVINSNGNREFYFKNQLRPRLIDNKICLGDNKIPFIDKVASLTDVYDDVASTHPAVGSTLAAILDQIYPFFGGSPRVQADAVAPLGLVGFTTSALPAAASNSGKIALCSDLADLAEKEVVATYSFATHGGAVSEISLGVTIPSGATITDVIMDETTTLTSTSSTGTIELELATGGDGTISDVKTCNNSNTGVLKAAVAQSSVKTTQARLLTVNIKTNAILAGVMKYIVKYIPAGASITGLVYSDGTNWRRAGNNLIVV
jgi:hypothetical protein